jgi:NADH dehydrogenase (ubiquinone) Fe-S protein 5
VNTDFFSRLKIGSYYMGFVQCYAQTDNATDCRPQGDDYVECLFHKREVRSIPRLSSYTGKPTGQQIERAKQVKAEFIRKAEHQAKEGRKAADVLADGVIVGVGLIQRNKGGDAGSGGEKSG